MLAFGNGWTCDELLDPLLEPGLSKKLWLEDGGDCPKSGAEGEMGKLDAGAVPGFWCEVMDRPRVYSATTRCLPRTDWSTIRMSVRLSDVIGTQRRKVC